MKVPGEGRGKEEKIMGTFILSGGGDKFPGDSSKK